MGALVRRRGAAAPTWPVFDWPAFDWPNAIRALPELRVPELLGMEAVLDREGMRIEERRDGDELVVRAEMPGIDPDKDIEITVTDGTLRLTAERRQEAEERDDGSVRTEFRYGRFTRLVPLPAGATEDDVKASYNDGILEVRVPVASETAKSRKVPVTRS